MGTIEFIAERDYWRARAEHAEARVATLEHLVADMVEHVARLEQVVIPGLRSELDDAHEKRRGTWQGCKPQ